MQERWFTPHTMQDGMLAYRLVEGANVQGGRTVGIGYEGISNLDRAAGMEPVRHVPEMGVPGRAAQLPGAEAAQAGENQGKARRFGRQLVRGFPCGQLRGDEASA